ncbi:S1C family serine protease [Nocardioides bruguierae]|uniref:Trypsin-like peptidase domain-containing protein n=1 Tax=Nocardioides bruguierae TaxID=2945102 RepID=A0A9X2IG95_9ACTN|nr:trypsin-like peptidase domain-containing protein [Nocardioides bruguierae]MCM0620545.1 trypsin-like peptidase domain-containing protein [Nocardioides bruguierae]
MTDEQPTPPPADDPSSGPSPASSPASTPAPAPRDSWVPPSHGPLPYPVRAPQQGPAQPGQQPGQQPYAQAYPQPYPAAAPAPGAPGEKPRRVRASRWTWPLVSVLALVLGAVGGVLGGALVVGGGTVSGGLPPVDVVTGAPIAPEDGSVAAVAAELLPSTVQIVASDGAGSGGTGSGFVLDRDGHVVTNNHVIDAAVDDGRIVVVDANGNRYPAELVGRSAVYDLAVLLAPDMAGAFTPASLGASSALQVGETVVAIGSPLGLSSTVTSGIVSALGRPVTVGGGEDASSYINAVQTDAAINPGNSGGPLVNLVGQVVGVNSAIATAGGSFTGEAGSIGVGFAIPVEQVRVTVDQILRTGEARYPIIGADVQTASATGAGARIRGVNGGSPAEDAGLRAGDLVTRVGDVRVTDGISLIVAIRTYQPGETVTLTYRRDGDEATADVTLMGVVG